MIKQKVVCPICKREISLSGIPLHTSRKHPEHVEEIKEMVKALKEEQKVPVAEDKVEFQKADIKKEAVQPATPSTEVITKPAVVSIVSTDDEFRVIPVIKPITPTTATMVDGKLQVVTQSTLSEDEMTGLLSALLAMPVIILPKLTPRTKEQITPFAHELTLYCQKKGINARDYLFDELPIVLTGVTLAATMYQDYKLHYPKDIKKEPSKVNKKLSNDFDHDIEVAKKNEDLTTKPEEPPKTRPDGSHFEAS